MLRILIADNHEVLRRGLLALLEQHADWHVIGEASNGREAVRNTEVLIFTVHESEDLVRDVLAAGARGYLLKTELTHNIVAAIESLAEHKPFFSWQISKKLLDNYLEAQAVSAPSADALTAREREVIQLLAEGRSSKSIAALLGLGAKTVETDRASIMKKLEAKSLADLVRYALRARIIEP